MEMSNPTCPECGYAHPINPNGCPLKTEKTADGQEINWNQILEPLRQSLIAKTKMLNLNLEDSKKLASNAIVAAVKWIEENHK